jgi:hypothetical protein
MGLSACSSQPTTAFPWTTAEATPSELLMVPEQDSTANAPPLLVQGLQGSTQIPEPTAAKEFPRQDSKTW